MKSDSPKTESNVELRAKAEKRITGTDLEIPGAIEKATREDVERILHELRVHQIELEMQNEALRAAQSEIEASRSRYADLYDFAPVGYLSLNRRGYITEANLAGAAMLGTPRADLKGKPFLQFLAREDRSAFHTHLDRAFTDPAKQTCELRILRQGADALYVSMESLVGTSSDDDEGPVCRSVIVDISARRLAEEERTRLAAAVDQAVEAIIITDLRWVILYANPAACTGTGYNLDELIGRKASMLRSKADDPAFLDRIKTTLKLGLPWSGRTTNRRKDGTTYQADLTISPVMDASSRPINYVSVARDITEQVAVEARLRQSQKMEAIGTLAGGIAHDFNNVLAAILGFTELAMDEASEGSVLQRAMRNVLQAAIRGRDLVRQILTFSHKSDLVRTPLHLKPVIGEAVKLLRASLPSAIAIELQADVAADEVVADETEINQLLINLGANAAYAMRRAGGRLSIALTDSVTSPDGTPPHPDLTPGNYLALSVQDTGCGMDAKTMVRIFEPFFTTRERGQGTGLGLAMVHGTVRSLGGAITVASQVGRGATFTIFLPKAAAGQIAQPEKLQAVPGGRERILFVDDEPLLVESAKTMLCRLGYDVVATSDPNEALSLFSASPERFDLVITDYTMPKMNGVDLARVLTEIRPNVPIILCTGYNETLSPEELRARGIRELCMKPLTRQEMAEIIRRVLDAPLLTADH